jgi:hypothetical protein
MPTYDGRLLTLNLVLKLLGVSIDVNGTVEVLDIRRRVEDS